ncbi:LysE/ArgO family amino acid transporter [Desulfobacterales bacterium HSG17]|nr:LysE/ArgO family amino acid transporter [Desulfobacterales bacterium HSG17]
MFIPFIQGFGMGGGLIVAIGAQNAFVLSHGVRKNHSFIIPLICSICDALLIMAGIAGVGAFVAANPFFTSLAAWGGAVFLFWYGFKAFCSALKGGKLDSDAKTRKSLQSAIIATLAITLLNPHVYLDTIILLGSISGQYQGNGRIFFGAGAMSASFIWFFSLSLGGQMLAPFFRKKAAWRLLDSLVCATMWIIAFSLIYQEIVK